MAKTQSPPLKPAERLRLEEASRPTPERGPNRWIEDLLAELPASALTLTAGELHAIYRADVELAAAQAAVAQLPAAASDPRSLQHAAARDRLTAYLEPLHRDTADSVAEIPHFPDCPDAATVEAADHAAEIPYGRCRVRIARCVSCGAQVVANRRLTIPAHRTPSPTASISPRRLRRRHD